MFYVKHRGWGIGKTARHLGYYHTTIGRWLRRYTQHGEEGLKDRSRIPRHIPGRTDDDVKELILSLREQTGYCHQHIRTILKRDFGIEIGETTVYRLLKKEGLVKKRKKRWKADYLSLPEIGAAGDLIQADVKILVNYSIPFKKAWFQYVFLDAHSRYLVSEVEREHNSHTAYQCFLKARKRLPIQEIILIQTDNGPVIRTISEQCLSRMEMERMSLAEVREEIRAYEEEYNHFKPNIALKGLTPAEVIQKGSLPV